jgi:hypothetical protein
MSDAHAMAERMVRALARAAAAGVTLRRSLERLLLLPFRSPTLLLLLLPPPPPPLTPAFLMTSSKAVEGQGQGRASCPTTSSTVGLPLPM